MPGTKATEVTFSWVKARSTAANEERGELQESCRKSKGSGTAVWGSVNGRWLGCVKGLPSSMEGPAETVLEPAGTGI